MSTYEVITYVKNEHGKGTALDEIRRNLLENGWSDVDVNIAIAAAGDHIRLRRHQVIDDSDLVAELMHRTRHTVRNTLILMAAAAILIAYLVFTHFYNVTVEPKVKPQPVKPSQLQQLLENTNAQ